MREGMAEHDKAEINKGIREFFISYMESKGYQLVGKALYKKHVVIKFMHGGYRIRIFDNNKEHKFTNIAMSLTPTTVAKADALYELLEVERKEMGTKAWRERIKQDKEQ